MSDATNIAQGVIDASNPEHDAGPVTWAHVSLARAIMTLDQRLAALEREQREIMTLDDVAGLLTVHTETVRRYYGRDVDPLPVHRPSERSLVFLRSEVLAWLTRQ